MNIDERLELIGARLDRMAAQQEFFLQQQASQEDNLNRLFEWQGEATKKIDQLFELQGRNEHYLAQLMETVNSLARIAHAHEQRITDLEDRSNKGQ